MTTIDSRRTTRIVPQITPNAMQVLEKRYLRKDKDGRLAETPEQLFWRVARALAEPDRIYNPGADVDGLAEQFYGLMATLDFLPNSPTLMNAGTNAGTLSACFVLPVEDSMESIMKAAHDAAMVQKFGGGTGFPLSFLRPKGATISTTHGKACGPIAVLRHLSSVSKLVTQGGKRDGANMAVMSVTHPDIEEFIDCKKTEGEIHNFNISIGATDDFMRRAEAGQEYDLIDPRTGEVVGKRDARAVMKKAIENAWLNGEPGMVFLDRVNRDNPAPHIGQMSATNPCGEQPLLPYESCNLGSINLAKMTRPVTGARLSDPQAEIDWERLERTVRLTARMLDNVIDANRYSVREIEEMTKTTRKTGLGVMGLADLLIMLRIPYNSEQGLEVGRRLMKFIREKADDESIKLARERGPFPAYKGSRLEKNGVPPIRNACRLTVAPTGTISMVAGCSSGIEPIFALAYHKHNILEGKSLYYIDPQFEHVARTEGFYSDELMEHISNGGSIQTRSEVPDWVKRAFVTAPDITPEWHVRMQAAFQESVDSAISKTINFPNAAKIEDVETAYLQAWKLGCKGITVYRAGSRQAEVLTAGKEKGKDAKAEATSNGASQAEAAKPRQSRGRPAITHGLTERLRTGHGNLYVTINFDDEGRAFEIFSAQGKAGGCDSAQLEAISRLVSLALRSGIDPEEIVAQLRGITCCPTWDGGVQIRSTPDAVSLALAKHLTQHLVKGPQNKGVVASQLGMPLEAKATDPRPAPVTTPRPKAALPAVSGGAVETSAMKMGCPECGGALAYQEGCLMCHDCGYNKCG